MAATLARLKQLHDKVGDVGVDKLLRAAKKEELAVDRQLVKRYLSTDAPGQIFKPLPEARGQSGAEAQGFRLQADLIDFKQRKAVWQGTEYSAILVIIDVASRRVWALPLRTKAPQDVGPALSKLIRTIKNAPGMEKGLGVITTDRGQEFTGEAADVLRRQGLTHRAKDPADPNIMAVLDRAVANLKRRLARSVAGESGPWPSRVAKVVQQYNDSYHPAIRDEPQDFNKPGHQVKRFLAEQDNAKKLDHNQKLLEKRTRKLEAEGGYRVPVGGLTKNKFRRSFYQSYSSDVKELDQIRGSMVRDKGGEETDIKRVQVVDLLSGRAEDGLRGKNPRGDRRKDILGDLVAALRAHLEPGARISTSAAAKELKRVMGDAEYRAALRRAGFQQLARAVALFGDKFEVEPGGYYLRRVG